MVGCQPAPLLIVDSLLAFFTGPDENDVAAIRSFFNELRRLSNIGASVLALHNSGKSENSKDYRGSSDILASVDCGFHCSNVSSDPGRLQKLFLRPYKARVLVRHLNFKFEAAHGFEAYSPDTTKNTEQQHIEVLTDLLRANPGIKRSDFEALAAAEDIRGRVRGTLSIAAKRQGRFQFHRV